uniref:5'-nucleotidase n=1 Tax=Lutzomyia longipalpis TaxID=7200 RepID=A0A1B0CP38_LUTLO
IRGYGKFLQVSGLRIVYDLSHNSGDRVTLVEILCSTCKVPHYEPLMPHKWYQIIIPEFLRKGGDGFTQFQNSSGRSLPFDDSTALETFISKLESDPESHTVRDALEYSVNGYNRIRGYGKFLQVSGLRIVYDLSHNSGDRVTLVEILCSTCKVPHYEPLMPHKWYQIIIPEFLRKGGDGFTQFQVFIS